MKFSKMSKNAKQANSFIEKFNISSETDGNTPISLMQSHSQVIFQKPHHEKIASLLPTQKIPNKRLKMLYILFIC